MDYKETLDYLFNRLPMFSRIGAAAYKKDLNNTIALCEALDHPELGFLSVHIAGTNGKGSVSHMLAAIFQTAGYKTGLYTSPHLKDFRERIRINGAMVPEEFVVRFTERTRAVAERIEPSFFEITVAMAFSWFKEQAVDIAIIETGLGGRLDSTNIIQPELSVITNIGMDHMNLLGDTLPLIAAEKAGIIKAGTTAIIGEFLPETRPVFEKKAREMEAPLIFASEERKVLQWEWKDPWLLVTVQPENASTPSTYRLDLTGIYQVKNLLTVLAACQALQEKGWQLREEHICRGLEQVRVLTGLHGRWEILHRFPLLIVDVAHNEDGIREMIRQLGTTPHEKLHIILGAVSDKDITAVLSLLPREAHYYFTKAPIPRALPENELLDMALNTGLNGKAYSGVNTALYAAAREAGKNDLILICGSIFLAGDLRFETIRDIWGNSPNSTAESGDPEMAGRTFFS